LHCGFGFLEGRAVTYLPADLLVKRHGLAMAAGFAAILCALAPADARQINDPGFRRFVKPAAQHNLAEAELKLWRQRNLKAEPRQTSARKHARRVEEPKKEVKKEEPVKIPSGPMHIIISINNQRLSVYSNGVQIAQAPVSTGTPGHSTPMGVFTVIQKQKWHRSNLYSSAPMPYMQRITWSGVAMHAGVLPGYPASHGCIRMPAEFAVRLYGLTKMGARVIIARNDAALVEIAHPRLFLPKKPAEAPLVAAAPNGVQMAQADISKTDAAPAVIASAAVELPKPVKAGELAKAQAMPRQSGPVSVFISRKERKLFVRQNSQPLFDAPVVIQNPELPLGTHVLTAMEFKDEGAAMRWTAVSIPSDYPRATEREMTSTKKLSREEREKQAQVALAVQSPTAAQALDRLELPKEAVERISEMLTPGSSLTISDNGISDETGSDTDFVVLTR
jgi:lipoprotein-anchoring transpeptidase ErfK/SrfK